MYTQKRRRKVTNIEDGPSFLVEMKGKSIYKDPPLKSLRVYGCRSI